MFKKLKQAHLTKPATTILYGKVLPPYPPGKLFPCGHGFLRCYFSLENAMDKEMIKAFINWLETASDEDIHDRKYLIMGQLVRTGAIP